MCIAISVHPPFMCALKIKTYQRKSLHPFGRLRCTIRSMNPNHLSTSIANDSIQNTIYCVIDFFGLYPVLLLKPIARTKNLICSTLVYIDFDTLCTHSQAHYRYRKELNGHKISVRKMCYATMAKQQKRKMDYKPLSQ